MCLGLQLNLNWAFPFFRLEISALMMNEHWTIVLRRRYYYMERFHKIKWLVQSFFFFLTFLQEFVIRTLKALTYGHSFIFDSFSFCNPLRKIISRYSLMVAWWNRSNTGTHISSKWFNHWFPEDDDLHTLGQYCPYLWWKSDRLCPSVSNFYLLTSDSITGYSWFSVELTWVSNSSL